MTQDEKLMEAIKPYLDAHGLVSPTPTHPGQVYASLNGLLYLSEYLIIREKIGGLPPLAGELAVFSRCNKESGVFKRAPDHADYCHQDDMIGIAAVNVYFAITLDNQGACNNWQYGPVSLRRFPQVGAHFLWASGRYPSWPHQLWWFLSQTTAALFSDRKGTDPWILSWIMFEVAKDKNWLTRLAHRIWRRRLYSRWPGGIKQVLGHYFTPDHPLAHYFPAGQE